MADRVLICIPTFQRPKMLGRLLQAIAGLETSADISVLAALRACFSSAKSSERFRRSCRA